MSQIGIPGGAHQQELFSARTLAAIFIVGILAFVGTVYLLVFADGDDPSFEIGPTTYSSSALGHKALLQTLRRLQVPVIVSRFKSGEKAGSGSLLVLLEPDPDHLTDQLIGGFGNVPHGLLALPKWAGDRDRRKPNWVGAMKPLPLDLIEPILKETQIQGMVQRVAGTFTVEVPDFGGTIEITDPQVLVGAALKPIVTLKGGVLVGEMTHGTGRQWVVADPDILSNHGIDQADNAVVAVSMIEALRPRSGVVIFDEIIHGFEQRPNLMKTALQLPFSIVTLSALVAVLLAIWAGVMRFGRPQVDGRALQPGKVTLIRTAADLLHQAGRRGGAVELVLTRYLRAQVADTLAQVNAPRGLDERRQIAWLDNLASARKPHVRLQPLADAIEAAARAGRTDPARALRLAADLHAWKQEYLHGLGKTSIHR
mgnify:CR=1 FL=1|jgi:hypothetical protein